MSKHINIQLKAYAWCNTDINFILTSETINDDELINMPDNFSERNYQLPHSLYLFIMLIV